MKEMFRNTKVGDEVWNFNTEKWEVIVRIIPSNIYSIITDDDSYTYSGRRLTADKNPTIFWNKFEIPKEAFEKPIPNLKKNTLVLCWDNWNVKKKYIQYFKYFDDGAIITSTLLDADANNLSSHLTSWDNWELYEEKK